MQTTSLLRAAAILALTALLGTASQTRADTFPALNTPASGESHPGKPVWAELFTSDSTAATRFYSGVFGWTVTTVDQHGVAYIVFSNGGRPIAGLRQRSKESAGHTSRWISYLAVADIDATLKSIQKSGGEVRAPARKFPLLGSMAIATDNEGSPFGIIQSSSGETADTEPTPGDWNWFHLFVKSPKAASGFYSQVFTYTVAPDARTGSGSELLLSSGGVNRAGVSTLPAREDARPGWLGIVRVAKLDDALGKVSALGGEVMVPPHESAYGSRFAVIADPSGGTVGVVEYTNNLNPANRP